MGLSRLKYIFWKESCTMGGYRRGDRVRVNNQSTSRFHGCKGTVVGTQVRGLALTYEVSFDQEQGFLSQDNRFFEHELQPLGSATPSTSR